MKRVIKMSKAWIAALVFGVALTGCGGGGSTKDSTGSSVQTSTAGTSSTQTVDRSAALTWNAPLQRQNNESLDMGELAGYVISYGQNPDDLTQTVVIDDASQMEFTFQSLGDGTWYFTVQAEDINGLMSPPSDIVSKTI